MNPTQDERRNATSASNAEADSLCPGRHLAQRGLPDVSSEDATFGQQIHEALKTNDSSKLKWDQAEIFDSCSEIEEKLVREFFGPDADKVKVFREQRFWCMVDKKWEHSGKPDFIARHGPRMLILEYKTLPGDVPGSPTNQQLRDQVVLAARNLVANAVGCAVVQPLVTHKPETCGYDALSITQAEQEMFDRVRRSNDPNSPRIPGNIQCKFCKAKGVCKEYAAWSATLVPVVSMPTVPVLSWTPEQRAVFCEMRGAAQKWLDDCEAEMRRLLEADPEAVPGWFLEPGDIRKAITNPQELFNRFAENGGTLDQFMACVKITKTSFEEQLKVATKQKGKALKSTLESMLQGIVEEKQNRPSLARRKP